MNSPKMSIAQWGTAITSAAVIGGLIWCLNETVSIGKQTATVIESQVKDHVRIDRLEDTSDGRYLKTTDDITDLKVDIATTKELTALIAQRYQIDPDAVEARIKREIIKEQATTTALLY